ncbi:hypothetical protein V6248_19565, partial [Pseudoalteromonas agarivorans]|uniref:hypothetical protein n=1 Tax=Pseudoalteromonas agarivorans TaxID=176102 RepID=UPI00311E7821
LSDAQHQQHVTQTELTRAEQQQINIKQQSQTLKQNRVKLELRQSQSLELKLQLQGVFEQLAITLQEATEERLMCTEQVDVLTQTLEL